VAGDAAGLVDPITREGIYFALLSGQWAADAAIAGDALQYASRVRAEIIPELAQAARLKAAFFHLGSSGLLIQALRHSAAVSEIMADLIAGRQGYAGLKWRLLRTLEWRLAWQAIGFVNGRSSRRAREHGHQGARLSPQSPAIPDRRSPAAMACSRADTESAAHAQECRAGIQGASDRR
jgi:hypothetical protein